MKGAGSDVAFVIDACVVLAYVFEDERTAHVAELMARLERERALAPTIWPMEVLNGLVVVERRKHISAHQADQIRRQVGALPIEIDVTAGLALLGSEMETARNLEISANDAAYVVLAASRSIPLATIDTRLLKAAKKCGVDIVEA